MVNWKKFGQFLLAASLLCALIVLPASAAEPVRVTIDGEAVVFDNTYGYPFIDSANRTQVPFRKTLETFGCTVSWEDATRTAIAEKDGITVRVPIGQACIQVDGETVAIDTTSIIVNNRTYLPIRAVLEAFGAQVSWNNRTRCVVVTTGDPVLRVHFIDVGQGDGALLESNGEYLLIDGGEIENGSLLVSFLEKQGVQELKAVVCTHPHSDHGGGLPAVLAVYPTAAVYAPTRTYAAPWFDDFLRYTDQQRLEVTIPAPGDTIGLGPRLSRSWAPGKAMRT